MNNCDVQITSDYGWVHHDEQWGSVWFKGYIFERLKLQIFVKKLLWLVASASEEDIKKYLSDIDGHFAIVIKTPKIYEEVVFKDINQNNVNLDDFKGKLILLNFCIDNNIYFNPFLTSK